MVYIVRVLDYDGGKRGMVWEEFFYKTLDGAKAKFVNLTKPRVYGNRFEPYVPYELKDRKPSGLIESACCKFAMIVVEIVQVNVED